MDKQEPLRIALIGYGKLGQAIAAVAPVMGAEVVAVVSPHHPAATARQLDGESALNKAHLCIEATTPECCVENLLRLLQMNKPIVTATTGWFHRLDEVEHAVQQVKGALLYGENFSIGIALFTELARHAATLLDALPFSDVAIHETHHRTKKDAPSGTALRLAEAVVQGSSKKKRVVTTPSADADALQVSAMRCGSVTGIHEVLWSAPHETIRLVHQADNRSIYAEGALHAARWLMAQQGCYHFSAMVASLLNRS